MARKRKKKFSQGGKLVGPSHEQGGIQGVVDGTEPIEVEGGEFILNKESTAALGDDFLHKLNATGTNMNGPNGFQPGQLGNGSNYQHGGRVTRQSRVVNGQNRVINNNSRVRGLTRGVTTEDSGHVHRFIIRANGQVDILPAYHPETKQIHHTHTYVGTWPNGYITENKSDCHPNCFNKYGHHGVGNHGHNINIRQNKIDSRNVTRGRKKYVGNRFSANKKSGRNNRARQLRAGTAVRGTMYNPNNMNRISRANARAGMKNSNSNRKASVNSKTRRNMS